MPIIDYRCVCGETISLEATAGGQCDHCGRNYAPEALQVAAAETASLPDLAPGITPTIDVYDPHEPDLYLGRTLGHFRILRRLGQGGMGNVYQALDTSLQRYVALKVIRAARQSVSDSSQWQRLFQEAIAQARVNHPNVVHIYYVGRDGDAPFLAMELVGGSTLAQRLEHGPMHFANIVEIAVRLADALRTCLQFDIVHGDIKPSNVLLTENGIAKLSDFGLSTRLSLAMHGTKGVAGTPNYLAPELVAGNRPTMHSDMYSLGVTLFEMTFGRLPFSFSGSHIQERLRAHQEAMVEFPQPWPAEVPQAWQKVLAKLMAKQPQHRFANYQELIKDLQSLRPVSLPNAGRLQRGLAWLVDYTWAGLAMGVVVSPVRFIDSPNNIFGKTLVALVAGAVSAAVPWMFAGIQAHWGTTPGKSLFQIRIVDRHGLRPTTAVLAGRSVVQMLLLWSLVVTHITGQLGTSFGFFGIALQAAAMFVTLLDAGIALIENNRRSIHDLIFDTRVVLDAGPQEISPSP